MDNTDLISVIIPTYNRAHLIKRSVESVLNQTYKNIELIIVDDGSTDNTKEVIDSINDKRIVYVKQENQGASAARNKGIDLANGKYIAFQDSDDVWHLDKLEKQVHILKQNNADVVFCKKLIRGNLRTRKIAKWFKEGFLKKDELPIGIGTQTVLIKRDIILNNKFDLSIFGIEDFEVCFKIKKNYSFFCIDEGLVDYYFQQDSISNKSDKIFESFEKIFYSDKDFLNRYSSFYLNLLAEHYLQLAFKIQNNKIKKRAFDLVFKISKSKNIKIKYFYHKFYFYKIREMLVKTITIPTKNIIKLFRKFI